MMLNKFYTYLGYSEFTVFCKSINHTKARVVNLGLDIIQQEDLVDIVLNKVIKYLRRSASDLKATPTAKRTLEANVYRSDETCDHTKFHY